MMFLAASFLLGQALLCGLLIKFVRTFGRYTETLKRIHDSNLMITSHQDVAAEEVARAIDRLEDLYLQQKLKETA